MLNERLVAVRPAASLFFRAAEERKSEGTAPIVDNAKPASADVEQVVVLLLQQLGHELVSRQLCIDENLVLGVEQRAKFRCDAGIVTSGAVVQAVAFRRHAEAGLAAPRCVAEAEAAIDGGKIGRVDVAMGS